MLNQRRMVSLLLSLAIICSLLAGCGEKPADRNSSAPNDGQQGAALNYPDASDNPSVTIRQSDPPTDFSETAVPGTLTVAQGGEPKTLYPQEGNQIPAIIAMRPLYETLINYNVFTNEYEGRLAERWERVDDETIRFYLRKGIKCHAGYEMTAEDVLWTAKQGQESPISNYLWQIFDLDRCKAVDEYTVDLVTNGPFGPVLAFMSDTSVAYIVSKQAYEEQSPEDYARNPTGGTGPYKFVEWIAGDRVTYERNEDYWGDKPYYKNLVIRNIADDVTRALSLESGEVDVIYGIDTASYQTLVDSPCCNVVEFPSYQLIHMGLNNKVKPFDDPRVRQAIRCALDLPSMVNLAFSGQAEVADGCWPNSLSTYEPASGDLAYAYDTEKARDLLKEAGYEDGFTFDLWCAETTAWVQMAEMIQKALRDVNITAKVQVMDQNTLLAERTKGEYQAYIARFSCSADDTDWFYNRLRSGLPYEQNVCQYENERVDELLDLARSSIVDEERMASYQEVLKLWREDLPWISLACPKMCYGIRSTLAGIEPHPYGVCDLRYIHPINPQ